VTAPAAGPLVCPVCESRHAAAERFCADCGMPLVHAPGEAAPPPKDSRLAAQARKIRPGYAEGPPVRVAGARHQAEAELLQNLLLEEGIPSLVRRSGGFDVPDFLASGWREILVPASGADAARELLGDHRPPGFAVQSRRPPWMRALAATMAVVVLVLAAAAVLAPLY
jgi:hypothetical protein